MSFTSLFLWLVCAEHSCHIQLACGVEMVLLKNNSSVCFSKKKKIKKRNHHVRLISTVFWIDRNLFVWAAWHCLNKQLFHYSDNVSRVSCIYMEYRSCRKQAAAVMSTFCKCNSKNILKVQCFHVRALYAIKTVFKKLFFMSSYKWFNYGRTYPLPRWKFRLK